MNCPVCDSELKTNHCSVCGFDSTSSFEMYPTFFSTAVGSSIAKYRREWKFSLLKKQSETTIIRCKICGQRLIFGDKTCSKCGFELRWFLDDPDEEERKKEDARVEAYKDYYCRGTVGIVTYRYVKLPDGIVQKDEEKMSLEICEIRRDTEPGTLFWKEETIDLRDLHDRNSLLQFSGYIKDRQGDKKVNVMLEKPKRLTRVHIGVKVERDLSFRYILGTKEAYTQSEIFHF